MPAVPTTQPPAPAETVEQRFRRLEAEWMKAVGHHSSPRVHQAHPAFQEIIRLGEPVIPFLLRDLEKEPSPPWVWVLTAITGERLAPIPDPQGIERVSQAWLQWGREMGYL